MRIKTSQRGFVLLPLIIAVAVIAVISGSTALYQIQNIKQVDSQAEIQRLLQQTAERNIIEEPSPTILPATPKPSPSKQSQSYKIPAVAGSSTSRPSKVKPATPPQSDVPAIIEKQFKSVFGRMPTASESAKYKKLYREKGYTETGLSRVMWSDVGEERTKNLREKYGIDNSQSEELRKIRRETLQKYIDNYKTDRKSYTLPPRLRYSPRPSIFETDEWKQSIEEAKNNQRNF